MVDRPQKEATNVTTARTHPKDLLYETNPPRQKPRAILAAPSTYSARPRPKTLRPDKPLFPNEATTATTRTPGPPGLASPSPQPATTTKKKKLCALWVSAFPPKKTPRADKPYVRNEARSRQTCTMMQGGEMQGRYARAAARPTAGWPKPN